MGYEYVVAGRLAFTCAKCGELSEFNFKYIKNPENTKKIENFDFVKGGE